MPISADNLRHSIEFVYEYTTIEGEVIPYQMKFQHTIHGPTITIAQDSYSPIELPAEMFTEVAGFLLQQGAIKGSTPVKTVGSVAKPLGLPTVGRRLGAAIPKSEPLAAITQDVEEEVTVSSLDGDVKPKDDEAKALAERLKKERLEAKAKVNAGKSKIKSDHKPKDE